MQAMSDARHRIGLTTSDGRQLLWNKAGRVHDLPADLAAHWVAHFQPSLFQVMPDGSIVPRGADPKAVDIVRVAVAPVDADSTVSDRPTPE